jgi:hypothetical protein
MLGRGLHNKPMVDELIERYVEWREQALEVWEAYSDWTGTTGADRDGAACRYRAVLDREQRACELYAELVDLVGACRPAPALRPAAAA